MNVRIAQAIRSKIESYIRRAEEIKNYSKERSDERKSMCPDSDACRGWPNNKSGDNDCGSIIQSRFANALRSVS